MGLQNAFQQNYPKIWQNFQEKWSHIGLQRVFQNDNSWFDKIFKEDFGFELSPKLLQINM